MTRQLKPDDDTLKRCFALMQREGLAVSADDVVCDPIHRLDFLKQVWKYGSPDFGERDVLMALLNLRKRGGLKKKVDDDAGSD